MTCPHACCTEKANKVEYTTCVIKDILIAGITEQDIWKDVLGIADLDKKSDKEIVELVETKEMASKAFNSGSILEKAGISDYRRNQKSSQHSLSHLFRRKTKRKIGYEREMQWMQ